MTRLITHEFLQMYSRMLKVYDTVPTNVNIGVVRPSVTEKIKRQSIRIGDGVCLGISNLSQLWSIDVIPGPLNSFFCASVRSSYFSTGAIASDGACDTPFRYVGLGRSVYNLKCLHIDGTPAITIGELSTRLDVIQLDGICPGCRRWPV